MHFYFKKSGSENRVVALERLSLDEHVLHALPPVGAENVFARLLYIEGFAPSGGSARHPREFER